MIGLEPGSELGGFVIEAVAGRGGMGVVYRARQARPQRTVALKVIAPDLARDSNFRMRFERESEIAAQIEHPNVIPVYSVGEDDGVLYIAMRFVVGTDLRALIADGGRLEPRRAAALIDQVAQALDAAHARGLVHRDVKPSNVLIASGSGREHAYLTDFGLARHVDGGKDITSTGSLVGTVDYVAPEQVRGDRVDARTDVYSLGCMLHHALTGKVPFPRTNELATLYAHSNDPPPPARELVPDLPRAFDAVLARAMAKDPADRYQSAGDLGEAALAAVANESPHRPERSVAAGSAAPADTPTFTSESAERTRAKAPARGRRWPLFAGVAAAVVAVAVLVIVLVSGGGGGKKSGGGTPLAPSGDRVVGVRRTTVPRSRLRYTVAMSVPKKAPGGPAAAVPLTMSLLAGRGPAPDRVVQRERLPAPPYSFAKNSYISEMKLDANPDGSGNLGISWYRHPGDQTTRTCYFTLSLGGISLDSCG